MPRSAVRCWHRRYEIGVRGCDCAAPAGAQGRGALLLRCPISGRSRPSVAEAFALFVVHTFFFVCHSIPFHGVVHWDGGFRGIGASKS